MLRVLTLSTLFPDSARPVLGVFVERQTLGLAAHPEVELEVIAALGIPPWPLSRHARYRALAALPHQEDWKGLKLHRPRFPIIPGGNGRATVALMTRAILPLARALHRERPFDVVDAQFFFPDGPVAMRIAGALGLPFSIKARGADIHYWGRQPATARDVRTAGRAAYGLLAVSAALRADMAALGIPPDQVGIHHTGVDLDLFRPGDRAALKAGLGVEGPLIVSVGALIPRKGQALLIDALALLPGATLMLVGDGPDRGALAARAARLGLADRVRLTGAVAHGDLPDILAAADVMALASSSEGLANAWVESLACGTPIVITEAGGAREVLDRPEAGRIAERSAVAFAAAIKEILRAPPDPLAVRKAAEPFTWAANTAALFDHLSHIALTNNRHSGEGRNP